MIKTLTNIFERMFGLNKEPQLTSERLPESTPKPKKKLDRNNLTQAQMSLVKEALIANQKAVAQGYGKTKSELAEDFNRIFSMNKARTTWNNIFNGILRNQTGE